MCDSREGTYIPSGGLPIYCRIAEAVRDPSANNVSYPFFGGGCGANTLCLISKKKMNYESERTSNEKIRTE